MSALSKYLTYGLLAGGLATASCQEKAAEPTPTQAQGVSEAVRNQIKALGFNSNDVRATEGGYIVENDILLTAEDLNNPAQQTKLRVGSEEQYRTNNLVTGLPREITVSMDVANFPDSYKKGLDEAIRRYNAENLQIKFKRVSSGGALKILKWSENGAVGGFPSNGNPFPTIRMNPASLGNINSVNFAATVIAHEMGHCIGFRHTDWQDRRYSCGANAENPFEPADPDGAIFIPGTASGAEAKSWMLACQDGGDRPFTTNDKKALNYIY